MSATSYQATKKDPKLSRDLSETEHIMHKYKNRPSYYSKMENSGFYLSDSGSNCLSDGPSAGEFYLISKDRYKQKKPRSVSAVPTTRQPVYVTHPTPIVYTVPANSYPYAIPNSINPAPYTYFPLYTYLAPTNHNLAYSTNQNQGLSTNQKAAPVTPRVVHRKPLYERQYAEKPNFQEKAKIEESFSKRMKDHKLQPIRFYEKSGNSFDYSDYLIGYEDRQSIGAENRSRSGRRSNDKLVLALNKVNRAAENLNKMSSQLNQNMNSIMTTEYVY